MCELKQLRRENDLARQILTGVRVLAEDVAHDATGAEGDEQRRELATELLRALERFDRL